MDTAEKEVPGVVMDYSDEKFAELLARYGQGVTIDDPGLKRTIREVKGDLARGLDVTLTHYEGVRFELTRYMAGHRRPDASKA